jgi:hypothetical protein
MPDSLGRSQVVKAFVCDCSLADTLVRQYGNHLYLAVVPKQGCELVKEVNTLNATPRGVIAIGALAVPYAGVAGAGDFI